MRFRPELAIPVVAGLLLATRAPGEQTRGEPAPVVGTVLPSAPDVAPGRVAPEAPNALTLGRQRAGEGDWAGVISALGPWLEGKKASGRERTAGLLLFGLAHLELENWNLASGAFYRVRASGGPLASYGAWYEAVTDHKRGRHSSAASICREYRTRWPDGPEAENCLLLIGDAYALAGQRGASLSAYKEYLERHPDTPRKEEIQLGIALATAVVSPDQAIPLLQNLVLSHSWHSTALSAQKALDELGQRGHKVALPTDARSKMRLCDSERRCGRFAEAWKLFQELDALAAEDPEVARWVEQNEERIAWGTRQFDVYAGALERAYAEKPNPDLAWRIFVAWTREGEWKKAVDWARKAQQAHASHHRWKRPTEETVWAETLAGNYTEAALGWEQLARSRGGQDARFYAAFSTYRAGDHAGAEQKLSALADREGDWQIAATYWRAKARAAKGDLAGAEADRERVRAKDRHGWYRLLLDESAAPAQDERWLSRDGGWSGALRGSLPDWTRPEVRPFMATGVLAMTRPVEGAEDPRSLELGPAEPSDRPDWGALSWPLSVGASAAVPPPAAEASPLPTLPSSVPDGYQACLFYDPVAALQLLEDFFKLLLSAQPFDAHRLGQ